MVFSFRYLGVRRPLGFLPSNNDRLVCCSTRIFVNIPRSLCHESMALFHVVWVISHELPTPAVGNGRRPIAAKRASAVLFFLARGGELGDDAPSFFVCCLASTRIYLGGHVPRWRARFNFLVHSACWRIKIASAASHYGSRRRGSRFALAPDQKTQQPRGFFAALFSL